MFFIGVQVEQGGIMSGKKTNLVEKLKEFPIEDGEIISVEWIEKMEKNYPFYHVIMKLHPSEKSDITVVIYLPEPRDWNGNFMGTGNGGSAGVIASNALRNGLIRGYATANTDMGTSREPDNCIGNMEVVKDFGFRATHLMTVVGKQLTTWFYSREPKYSYFVGASTGGQQAFSEVQRYPEDYDGIIALAPAFDRVRLHTFFIWNWQQIHRNENKGFSVEQIKKWKEAVIQTYRKVCLSNEEDNFLAYPGGITCNPIDDPVLKDFVETLFTPKQQEVLRQLYEGPIDPVTKEHFIS